MPDWLSLCLSRSVVRRAAYSAIFVGSILIAINHGDALLRGDLDRLRILRITLTIIVPYLVSTISSTTTILELRKLESVSARSR